MNFNKQILSNGLRVLTIPMPSVPSATVTVWVKTGSRNEEKKNSGISHFLEHMGFKGSKKRPTAKEISEVIDGIGGEFNAGTGKEYTNYYVKCRKDDIETAFDILSDMLINPILDKKEIEREKGTIIEEIRMYEDTPMMKIGDTFEELIYSGSTLGWDISGTEKSVQGMVKRDFEEYRKKFYTAENMMVTVAGGVTEKQTLDLANKYFPKLVTRNSSLVAKQFENKQNKPQIKLHNKKKEQAHVILGFMADGKNYKGKYAQTILSAILGGGMSSRMFIEVRERRGLAYAIRTSMDRYSDIGYIGTYAGLDVKKAEEAVKVMLDIHYQMLNVKTQMLNKELTKAKEFLKGHLALALEDTSDVNSFFGDQELFGSEILTPEEVFKKIDKVNLEEVLFEAKRLFVPERLNLAIIGPYEDASRFKKLL
ncbi:MAG: Peptidase M16 domain protein [Candidatus Woesebacteria bacterium GW2011_GWA1_33_30]|uniref:Peptidase M16 domain protein n=1 Tax=Candidatus Woesebacteria bacterium GW2011_GWA2_33_28 TaxID=1618561 RepID=A0A0F9ZRR7_9BACT|nr:MAG: Peptidase M16 domain protein [Candidatus Woesebacteria bacterium GW2011_GWA2_33_28]KKP47809.1 MAG: Peptidase M16 domain protein [Candidatus Woesebacteria bacterium GW2011_GWA1_33_30]KKP49254.1 MAG: Processing protease [Microgenomates group bacterium GW2011_GWC1_33_32]KKP51621.1 MAG: Peptidase M16 domain protein [Candidatus Woesebacteria bacterium GW2011_GWB1_33_38]KKP57646.1 MAG: Peptidase M16 domain protein [Microgenomates group bacterium GW2011_GWD1_33_9]